MPDLFSSSPLSVAQFGNQIMRDRIGAGEDFDFLNPDVSNEFASNYLRSTRYIEDIDDLYQAYIDKFNSAKLNAVTEDNVLDFIKTYSTDKSMQNSLDPGAVQSLVNYYLTEKSNNTARDFASRSNQIMVEDLKKAGLNPALLASNPQGMTSVSGSDYSGNSSITTSARDKANIKYKYDALNARQMLAGVAIAVQGIGHVLSSASRVMGAKIAA